MNETAKNILVYLKEHPQATYADIGKAVNIGATGAVAHNIKSLMAIGRLKRVQKWIVK